MIADNVRLTHRDMKSTITTHCKSSAPMVEEICVAPKFSNLNSHNITMSSDTEDLCNKLYASIANLNTTLDGVQNKHVSIQQTVDKLLFKTNQNAECELQRLRLENQHLRNIIALLTGQLC